MLESILVGTIVAAALVYAAREIVRNVRRGSDQCSNCSLHTREKGPGGPR
jgi:hypothetical protein